MNLVLSNVPTAVLIAARLKVLALEDEMRKMPQVDIPIKHYFGSGIYMREMEVPAGVTLTGKIHRTDHICVLAKGRVTVYVDGIPKEYSAPCIIPSRRGAKRAIYVHEDAKWTNIHRTDEKNLAKIEEILLAPTFEDLGD